jgi:hypothetical protein
MHQPAAGPTGRCPVKPSTPLGPDQVNVIIIIICETTEDGHDMAYQRILSACEKCENPPRFFSSDSKTLEDWESLIRSQSG